MPRLTTGIWSRLFRKQTHRRSLPALRVRPSLEVLEDRTTPSVTASGVLSGSVFVGGGHTGLSGIDVTLTGSTTTGRSINVSTITDANGEFDFTQVLPGTYSVARAVPNGFINGTQTTVSGISLAQGQTKSGVNLRVAGLAPSQVSLAYFLNIPRSLSALLPAPGSGTAKGFTLSSATPLADQTVSSGTTTYLDLSANFIDPDTTNGTLVTFNTSQGAVNIKLFDKDAPQTVTNFLDNIQAQDYSNGVFSRLSNLSQTSPQTTPPKPYQVLQGGGTTVNADNSNKVTGFNTVITFQPIQDESNDTLHSNTIGSLAMARSSVPNSATSQFFFNLTDNAHALAGSPGNGFAVFGQAADSQSLSVLEQFASQYTPTNESKVNSSFFALPLLNGFTPASNFPTGATTSDLAVMNSVTVTKPPTGHLTYTILSNSNPSVVDAKLGTNTSGSTFSANQLQLVAKNGGSAVITLEVTDKRGESVITKFTVHVVGVTLPKPANQTNLEGATVKLSVAGSDSNGAALTYSATGLPAGLSIGASTGIISGTIQKGAFTNSPYTVTVTADSGSSSASQTFTWTVKPVVAISTVGTQTNVEGDVISLQVSASDAKKLPLTYSDNGTLPPGLSINATTGLISGTIANGASGASPYAVTITVSDGTFEATLTFTWVVNL